MVYRYLLSIGSNIEPKLENLNHALEELNVYGEIIQKSSIYKTEPWGIKDQSDFYNAVVRFDSGLTPKDLLSAVKKIESKMGRVKSPRWGQRNIDIDILFADDIVINDSDLTIPHAYLTQRRFVLAPLAELTHTHHLPCFFKSAEEMLNECTDSSIVEKLPIIWD